ncbi:MAG: HAMP domain-containing histidine kinase [Oscillibacter sp.]|nr:HAMP domain-containing histidine kinase [Oscillibacter sp.]
MSEFNYTGRVSRKLLAQYALSLFGSLGIVVFLAAGCTFFFGVFSFWRDNILLTYIVYFCRDYILLLFLLSLGLAWLGCTIHFIRKPLDFLDELAGAAEQLTQPDGEPISLPPELSVLEEHLNWAHSQALRDQRAAREAEQRKNDLVVYLAHDLKTPLTSVIGYLTLLRDEPELPPEFRARYTGVALDKAERLEDLINEFFDVTRFNLSHMELEKRPCDLSRMLQQVASEFAPMLKERGLFVRLDLPETLPYPCDPDKLARVFDNLLRNACHYGEADSAVDISARREAGGETLLSFANRGATIPPDKLERVFEQFFRLDSSRATHTGGAGLGLAIAREIVELHGGSISAQSRDGVTVFTVLLPPPQENRKNFEGIS